MSDAPDAIERASRAYHMIRKDPPDGRAAATLIGQQFPGSSRRFPHGGRPASVANFQVISRPSSFSPCRVADAAPRRPDVCPIPLTDNTFDDHSRHDRPLAGAAEADPCSAPYRPELLRAPEQPPMAWTASSRAWLWVMSLAVHGRPRPGRPGSVPVGICSSRCAPRGSRPSAVSCRALADHLVDRRFHEPVLIRSPAR